MAIRVSIHGLEATYAEPASLTIGRDPACVLVVDHPLVSGRHVVVRSQDSTWVVEDAGSRNGLFHDGVRIQTLIVDGSATVYLGDPTLGPPLTVAVQPTILVPSTKPLGTLTAMHRPAIQTVRIGRDPSNDIVVDDLLVSRYHAEMRAAPDTGLEVVDCGSHNGTFVNGQRVDRATVSELDVVTVGHHLFRVTASGLEEYADDGPASFEAIDLGVRSPSGKVLLDGVSFALGERSFLAVVGPSGAGKSTLLNALTGFRPAPQGVVLYNGRDLYDEYEDLRSRIGLVPQDDVVHLTLTVAQALEYAAQLRFPADVAAEDRRRRVVEVMDQLGLSERADVAISALSGGQRKRVSVALELLTRPSLLFLDEPTSGLDPGYERTLMQLLRQLADDGRTVVVVTHSVQSLRLCDRVMFLAPGGRIAYFGPPQLALAYFECEDFEQVFTQLSVNGVHWADRWQSPDPQRTFGAVRSGERAPQGAVEHAPGPQSWLGQLSTLTRRYARVMVSDRRNLALLLLQAPLLGLVLLVSLPPGELGKAPATEVRLLSNAALVLFVVMLTNTWIGALNAAREIVKEMPIIRRERAVGLSLSAYVMSKALVLGALTALQAAVLTAIALSGQKVGGGGAVLGWSFGELLLVAVMVGLAAMALGLLLSALVTSSDQAMTVLPVLLILQIVLAAGTVFPALADRPGLSQLAYASSTQWGVAASASTVTLNDLQKFTTVAAKIPTVRLDHPEQVAETLAGGIHGRARWNHTPTAWFSSVAALTVITALCLMATTLALRRYDPGVS